MSIKPLDYSESQSQKNCSIKDEDELAQIIGKYRMTSDLHWVEFKGGVDKQIKQTVVKKNSYSSDSLDEYCEENNYCEEVNLPEAEKSKDSSEENSELDMNDDKSLSQTSSDISSVHDNISITSTYSFETVEETEALQTENITESIDIRISPRNSTVMSFNCANNFYSEFSLVANVEVQIPDANENFDDTKTLAEEEAKVQNCIDIVNVEGQNEAREIIPEIQSLDINANNNVIEDKEDMIIEVKENHCETRVLEKSPKKKSVHTALDTSNTPTSKKTEYFENKIEITKQEKKMSSLIEKKIAEEIKAMKEREEEIRAMREKLAKEMSEKSSVNRTPPKSDILMVPKPEIITPPTFHCDEKPVIKKPAVMKVENAYTTARVFAIKRKDTSIGSDTPENNNSPCAITHQESPVEREIRIAKQREEELKQEREQALKAKLEMDLMNSECSANETDADSALSICSDSSFDSVSKLAPLFPRTVSPETSNSNGISVYSSSAGSICSLESPSQRERQINGSHSAGGSISASVLSPSPDSANCKPGFPFSTPKITAERRSKSIDMERFISSKGKEIKFKDNKGGSGNILFPNYYEIKPPQVKKGEEMTCKRFITTATKIQNELKEMQEREEQFKKEHATLLQDIKSEENEEKKDENIKENNAGESPVPSPVSITNSESSEDLESKKKQDNSANPTRRRSVLIDEWEQRIQKSTLQP